MGFRELKEHGKEDFPFQLYKAAADTPKYVMVTHWHPNIEIVRILEGKLTLTLDNRTYEGAKGDLFFVNSETLHGGIPTDCVYECFIFNAEFLKIGNAVCDAFINSLIFHNTYIHEKIDDKEIKKTTDLLFETIDRQQDGFHFSVIGLTQQLLGQIQQKKLYSSPLPSYEKTDKKRVKLKKVLKYVREHFSDDITLYNMAEIAELTPNYFSSYFKSVTDKTPIDYLISYRIERAASKLLSTDLPVTQIAYDCGFNDLSYFIKLFKKHTGFSPAKYRETIDKTII